MGYGSQQPWGPRPIPAEDPYIRTGLAPSSAGTGLRGVWRDPGRDVQRAPSSRSARMKWWLSSEKWLNTANGRNERLLRSLNPLPRPHLSCGLIPIVVR